MVNRAPWQTSWCRQAPLRRFSCYQSDALHPSRRGAGAARSVTERQALVRCPAQCPTPPAPPSLQELRKEIDAIDEQVHRLLMARGDIIDRLIQVKQTQEVGSAFRPAREASMMRRAGRSAIAASCRSTPSRASGASSSRPSPMCRRRSRCMRMSRSANPRCGIRRGFISASSCPMWPHFSAQAAVEAVAKSKGDLALVSATSSRTPWWIALEAERRAEDHRAAAVPRARRSSGGAAGVRDLAGRRRRHGDRSRDVERARLRLERRYRARAGAARRDRRGARYRLRRRGAVGIGSPAPASRRSRRR